jgi:hypothetical protein
MYNPQPVAHVEEQSGSWAVTSSVTSPPGATTAGDALKLSTTGAAAHAPFAIASVSNAQRDIDRRPIAKDVPPTGRTVGAKGKPLAGSLDCGISPTLSDLLNASVKKKQDPFHLGPGAGIRLSGLTVHGLFHDDT